MASKHGSKTRKSSSTLHKSANSPPSSTTTSSKQQQQQDNSIEGQSSTASSSALSKPQYLFSEATTTPVHHAERRSIENVTVTVRFRPLSSREIRQGEEVAWYADGETIVRNEYNPSLAYAYDRVFGPTTTTRQVYDIAAQHVITGAMDGINGTIFAYGVTSSGKTHTMHGDQRSPGIIPLAVKDAFSIIQETPNREFLLRVTYLEIYNEVRRNAIDPTVQEMGFYAHVPNVFLDADILRKTGELIELKAQVEQLTMQLEEANKRIVELEARLDGRCSPSRSNGRSSPDYTVTWYELHYHLLESLKAHKLMYSCSSVSMVAKKHGGVCLH